MKEEFFMNTARKKRAAAGLLSILTALALVLPAAAHHLSLIHI